MAPPRNRPRTRCKLQIENSNEYRAATTTVMDLLKSEQLSGSAWTRAARLDALVCFAVACVLLGASLLTPLPLRTSGESALTAGSVVGPR
jgi:hypothetical protein